jgi:FkbM family methyltransferase
MKNIINKTPFYNFIWKRYHKRLSKKWTPRDHEMRNFYSKYITPGSLCFDVGANIGNRTKIFLELGASVVAIEPQYKCLEVIKTNYGKNANLITVDMALGAHDGQAEMMIGDLHQLSSLSLEWIEKTRISNRFPGHRWDKKIIVNVTTIDQLINHYGEPDFIKIDVEGHEEQVINGLSRPIKMLSFEFVKENINSTGRILNYLSNIGEIEVNYTIGESMNLFSNEFISPEMIYNILLNNLHDNLLWGDIYVRFKSVLQ